MCAATDPASERPSVPQARRLKSVRYDLRGDILKTVRGLEASGAEIMMLNLGNPAHFGLNAPDWLVDAVREGVATSDPYTDSRGLLDAREAVASRYVARGLSHASAEQVFLGNGVSELILMSVQALVDPGDEVLIPAPDYPLWTAATRLAGAAAIHYPCEEANGWMPDPATVESMVTPRTRALVLINPNNPTGAVYDAETVAAMARIADRHGLVLLSDEIYDEIIYDASVPHTSAALVADDARVITFGGLSKVWRACGYRGGWMYLSEGLSKCDDYVEGLDLLANLRLCPNVMAQNAVRAAAVRFGDAADLVAPGGELRTRRDQTLASLAAIDGVSCVAPAGALYAFPKIEQEWFDFENDQELALSFLRDHHVLLSHGSGFNLPDDPHLRLVFLADEANLKLACAKFADHLDTRRGWWLRDLARAATLWSDGGMTPIASRKKIVLAAALGLVASVLLAPVATHAQSAGSPGDHGWPPGHCPKLWLADHWYGDNAEAIQQVIDERGRCSKDRRGGHGEKPLAVFDWDNTVIKNDISDQTIFWMLGHDKILQPKAADWHNTSRYMTDAGADALSAACGTSVPAGEPLPTSTDTDCADELLSVRKEGVTTGGDEVFDGFDHRQMEASYAWVAQLNAGYRPAEVRTIARRARWAALTNPVGATQQVGSSTEVAWIRYYPEVRDLIFTLKRAGFDVWIVSASPKETADVWGGGVGVRPDHTIGIDSLTTHGVLNGHLAGCGGIPDGEDAIMPYVDGKRCFINKQILGIEGEAQLDPAPAKQRQALAGGDATTDVTMLRDATGVRVVLNRNKDELMCRAYDNADGRWAVNPMFIEPLPKREEPYPCSTTAYEDETGTPGPVLDDDGNVIPDQEDTIFG